MAFSQIFLLIFITTVAASYGWGMRGAVIGGEKGAMLPGALIGMCLALFSGIDSLVQNWHLIAATACLGMGFGGFEPYAQTSDFMLHKEADYYKPSIAFRGLMLKGANWFGICGAIIGIGLSAASGIVYKWYELVILFALQPFIQLLGIRIFNKPFDPKAGIFPKHYYSRTSREEWGGNLLFLVSLLLFAAIKGDFFSVGFGLVGIVSGSFGWYFSMWLCLITSHPKKNGKYILGKFGEKRVADTWKIMEFSYGAIAGLAFSIYFVLTFAHTKNAFLSTPVLYFGELSEKLNGGAWVTFVLILICPFMVAWGNRKEKSGSENGKMIARVCELADRAVYYALALCLVMLGNGKTARLILVPVILWVLIEENVFEQRLGVCKHAKAIYAVSFLTFAAVAAVEFLLPNGIPLIGILILYTVFYIVSDEMFFACMGNRKARRKNAETFQEKIFVRIGLDSVHSYFWLLSAILLITFICCGFSLC